MEIIGNIYFGLICRMTRDNNMVFYEPKGLIYLYLGGQIMKLKNVKRFVKEHKKEVFATSVIFIGGVVFYRLGYKDGLLDGVGKQKNIRELFDRIPKGENVNVFAGERAIALKLDEMGTLGKELIEDLGIEPDMEFNRFVMIGPVDKT